MSKNTDNWNAKNGKCSRKFFYQHDDRVPRIDKHTNQRTGSRTVVAFKTKKHGEQLKNSNVAMALYKNNVVGFVTCHSNIRNVDFRKRQHGEKRGVLTHKIQDIRELDIVQHVKFHRRRHDGKPYFYKHRNRNDDFIRDVQKGFPQLNLDDTDLPTFDKTIEGKDPPPAQRLFTSSYQATKIANQFMSTYFNIFDSDSREPLLAAYHENAIFSLTSITHKFQKLNRNFLHKNNYSASRKREMLKKGRLPVTACITEMPKTQHYQNTFTMDIPIVTDLMMMVTVTGLFKEVDTKCIHYFDRTFIIVREGTGYCIKNEQFHLSRPTSAQEKQVSDKPMTCPLKPAVLTAPSASTSATKSVADSADDVNNQMIMTLSQQTNMNLEWSFKCLSECNWNYDNAVLAFNNFFQNGLIPPEAFIK